MEINKTKVIELLKLRGLNDRAEWVDRQLPARIDVYDNASLLATLSINPDDLADDAPSDRDDSPSNR
jgi:hypothetical protein